MRAVFLVIDGMADRCIATKEDLAAFFRQDRMDTALGYFETCPKGFPPDSMVCLLTLLGVPETQIPHTGRAWLEALGAGFQVEKNGLAFRCSLVQVQNGKILSPCAAGIAKKKENCSPGSFPAVFQRIKYNFILWKIIKASWCSGIRKGKSQKS